MAYFSFINKIFFLFILLCLAQNGFGQTIQELENEIEQKEQQIASLEKKISRNNTTGNSGANATLKQQKDGYDQEIELLIKKIKILEKGGSLTNTNDCEIEIMAYREEIEATEDIITKLEGENFDLNKEIQRLTMEGGGSAEIEKLRKKIGNQKEEIQVLKGQIKGYKKRANNSSTSTPSSGTSTAQLSSLERKIARLERDKANLREQLQKNKKAPSSVRLNFTEHRFQQQFVNQNATTLVLGYRYSLLPSINYKEAPSIYQGSERVGTLTSTPNQQTAGHNGYVGIERLWHKDNIGGNIGLAGTYAYNSQAEMTYHIVGGQLGGELTILPLRMGLRISGTGGYVWGNIQNHSMRLEDGSMEDNPEFNTMIWGWESKLRVYISRRAAFTGSIGADYPISEAGEMGFWDTSLKFGLGLDVLLQVSK